MYGQTTGHGAQALRRLNAAYPVAMAYLDAADRAGRAGRDLRTYGGRLIVLAPAPGPEPRSSSRAAAYGRYARNAMIQGAAAELFKMWAVTVRARCGPLGARIVLCLHDELLVHCPREQAETVSRLVDECLREAAQRWAPGCGVRFISDTSIVRSWSDAKNAALDPAGPSGRAGPRAATRPRCAGRGLAAKIRLAESPAARASRGDQGVRTAATMAAANAPAASSRRWPAPAIQVAARRRSTRRCRSDHRAGDSGSSGSARWQAAVRPGRSAFRTGWPDSPRACRTRRTPAGPARSRRRPPTRAGRRHGSRSGPRASRAAAARRAPTGSLVGQPESVDTLFPGACRPHLRSRR